MQFVFEFDDAKSSANRSKHGIDFVEGQKLWLDENLLQVAGHAWMRCKRMKTSEFDQKFDDGVEDITGDLDMSTATRPLKEQRRVNVDFPVWMVESLDREAGRLGVTRQSIIKVWIAERLEQKAS